MRPRQPPTLVRAPGSELPLAQRDDDQLMQLACAGAPGALACLIQRHQGALRAYCARRCGSAGDDLAQEVFVTLWARRTLYQPQGQFRAYLFKLAEHRCTNHNRGQLRRARKHESQQSPTPRPDQLDTLLSRERQRRLHQTLQKLSADQQRAILLHYTAGLDYQEIAEIVARPVATIRTRVFLGLNRLRQLLGARGDT